MITTGNIHKSIFNKITMVLPQDRLWSSVNERTLWNIYNHRDPYSIIKVTQQHKMIINTKNIHGTS